MPEYGLIGKSLSHSASAVLFDQKFKDEKLTDCKYSLFELNTIEDFPLLISSNPLLKGLNVTIPYKTAVIPFLNELDETAIAVGAVNTIVIKNNLLKGYNTDVIGFKKSLEQFIGSRKPKALIAGTGGAAKAVMYVLSKQGIEFTCVSRKPADNMLTYGEVTAEILRKHQLIINCTPLGRFPDVHSYPPLPYAELTEDHFLLDLNYNPEESVFLKEGLNHFTAVQNGKSMLIEQAQASWEIWNS